MGWEQVGYSEPRLVTSSASDYYIKSSYTGTSYDGATANFSTILEFASKVEFGDYVLNSYQDMIESIDRYKGFYVARYETSLGTNNVAQSQSAKTALKTKTWYYMYYYQDSNRFTNNPYYGSKIVTTGMMTGNQWDAMLRFILTTTDSARVTATTNGNHTGTVKATGATPNDIACNIYDLEGNLREWLTEAYSTGNRVYRGGYYSSSVAASTYGNLTPTSSSNYMGSRMSLYIK